MKREKLSKAAASGAVALIFLVLGFQAAIFTGNVFKYNKEHRVDTVFVTREIAGQAGNDRRGRSLDFVRDDMEGEFGTAPVQHPSIVEKGLAPQLEPGYSDSRRVVAEKMEKAKKRPAELFEFDPNTISRADLVRLGFSEKQAQVIENYRSKGGKYNKPRDFARMYVVDSAMFARLEPYIRISKLNINTADSLALLELRGIGPYYAHKILEYRARLGGAFTDKEQLMEIEGLDADRLSGFSDAVEVKPTRPRFTLWSATKSELAAHPYIGSYAAKGIIRYRSITDTAAWSLQGLVENGVLKAVDAIRLKYLDIHP